MRLKRRGKEDPISESAQETLKSFPSTSTKRSSTFGWPHLVAAAFIKSTSDTAKESGNKSKSAAAMSAEHASGSVSVTEAKPQTNGTNGEPKLPKVVIPDNQEAPIASPVLSNEEKPRIELSDDGAPTLPSPDTGSSLGLLPEITLEDLASPGTIQFSKRGSVLIGGKRATELYAEKEKPAERTIRAVNSGSSVRSSNRVRMLTPDEEKMSRRVRSMYEQGSGTPLLAVAEAKYGEGDAAEEEPEPEGEGAPEPRPQSLQPPARNGHAEAQKYTRKGNELAGGIEDWDNVRSGEIDRYGFINPRLLDSNNQSSVSLPAPQLHRVSTSLQVASQQPRKRFSHLTRSSSLTKSARSMGNQTASVRSGYQARPASSQSYYRNSAGNRASLIRVAANRLPQNKDRRALDEAGDMLTLPPGLADIAEHEEGGKAAQLAKHKEWEREAKWRKMAKVVSGRGDGGGMVFDFDASNPKVLERTWKGIPDRWRATAWHSFISAGAKKRADYVPDAELRAAFRELIDEGSPDDVQIDLDVPRTISTHIMFRARYRGGQRLLFRVLHSFSLYVGQTGYVQGMAALAATLLCYYDEEMAFVMLVRVWQLRGFDKLYEPGFAGLMEALTEFEKDWLVYNAVGKKLQEHGITPTAYGTRWYLTLFNYSLPFPAQLRIWDVFFLLGDRRAGTTTSIPASARPVTTSATATATANAGAHIPSKPASAPPPSFDVLHAASMALIDAMRDILLDSDFENAMKVLTSWVPIRDEDLLMKVAKVEWKMRGQRR